IIKELEKPGRDPRPEFKTAQFADGVETMNDLLPGMILEGAVTVKHHQITASMAKDIAFKLGAELNNEEAEIFADGYNAAMLKVN
ncbi:hypothetical protein MJM25_29240, partial [Salmonella enterica subsp. enterica serovar Lubbock]|nr:hypothetical protein [Salmonella enterica subsp. enterica serovar Lubbock]